MSLLSRIRNAAEAFASDSPQGERIEPAPRALLRQRAAQGRANLAASPNEAVSFLDGFRFSQAGYGSPYEQEAHWSRTISDTRSVGAQSVTNLWRWRNRSRNLSIHSAFYATAINSIASTILGNGAVEVFFQIPQEEVSEGLRRRIEELRAEWRDWQEAEAITIHGESLHDALALSLRTWLIDGDFLWIRTIDGWQILAGDALAEHHSDSHMGIQVGAGMVPTGYWIRDNPQEAFQMPTLTYSYGGGTSALDAQARLFPADQVLHCAIRHDPTCLRGIPHGLPAMFTLEKLRRYFDSFVTSAEGRNRFVQVLQNSDPSANIGMEGGKSLGGIETEGEESETSGSAFLGLRAVERSERMGDMMELAPGYEMKWPSPMQSDMNEPKIMEALLGQVAGSLGLTLASITSDWSKVSFSGGQLGFGIERKLARQRRRRLAAVILRPIFLEWLRRQANRLSHSETERLQRAARFKFLDHTSLEVHRIIPAAMQAAESGLLTPGEAREISGFPATAPASEQDEPEVRNPLMRDRNADSQEQIEDSESEDRRGEQEQGNEN